MAGEQFSFPRTYRLTKTDEFSSVFGFRKAVKGKYFMLHYGPIEYAENNDAVRVPRIGIVVAKKMVKQAVRRNTIKRITREQFRLHCKALPAKDIIVRLMCKVNGMPRKELAAEIVSLLKRLRHQHLRHSLP